MLRDHFMEAISGRDPRWPRQDRSSRPSPYLPTVLTENFTCLSAPCTGSRLVALRIGGRAANLHIKLIPGALPCGKPPHS